LTPIPIFPDAAQGPLTSGHPETGHELPFPPPRLSAKQASLVRFSKANASFLNSPTNYRWTLSLVRRSFPPPALSPAEKLTIPYLSFHRGVFVRSPGFFQRIAPVRFERSRPLPSFTLLLCVVRLLPARLECQSPSYGLLNVSSVLPHPIPFILFWCAGGKQLSLFFLVRVDCFYNLQKGS